MKEVKKENLRLLKTAKGQIEGIIKMLEEDRYCIDISNQIFATCAIMKNVNQSVLTHHIHTCVLDAIDQNEKEIKLKEISTIISKLSKQ